MDDRPDWQQDRDWMKRVHALMQQGFGYEDIARRLRCDEASVRQEADRLRRLGSLDDLYRHYRQVARGRE